VEVCGTEQVSLSLSSIAKFHYAYQGDNVGEQKQNFAGWFTVDSEFCLITKYSLETITNGQIMEYTGTDVRIDQ